MFFDNHSVLYTASTAGVFWLSYRMIICVQFISKAKVNTSHHKEDKKNLHFQHIFFGTCASQHRDCLFFLHNPNHPAIFLIFYHKSDSALR